jgi:hypothetical protein
VISRLLGVMALIVVVAALVGCGSARSTTIRHAAPASPYWTGMAGQINRACYADRGVKAIFGGGGEYAGAVAVCRDGWAVNIPGGLP